MNDLLIQQYLRSSTLEDLDRDFHVKAKRHGVYPNLILLKYSQIDSPMGNPMVQECRGIILDEADNWRVISFPFRKFFNSSEGHAATINWTTATIYEKLDGSLITLFHYRDAWHVASSGMPDAAGPVYGAGGMTFAELFWKTFNDSGYILPSADVDCCFMFELMTPHNRVVVPHVNNRLVLIGVRHLTDNAEFYPKQFADYYEWECVRSFPLNSIDACLSAAQAINPMEGEGYVVCDANFNRIKVKSPQYVALAHMKEGMGGRRLLEVVRANESSEFLTYFPEWASAYTTLRTAFDQLCAELESTYAEIKDIPSQKDFAMRATKTRCSSALFTMRKGECKTAKEYLATCTMNALERALDMDLSVLLPSLESEAVNV